MMRLEKNATELFGFAPFSTIYIIGSGASMDFFDPAFFSNKFCIGVNKVYKKFPVRFTVMKHFEDAQEAIDAGQKVIVSRFDCGDTGRRVNEYDGEYFYFDHESNGDWEPNISSVLNPGCGEIFVSESTITSAIHIAAMMGAKDIILVGHDCGLLDGRYNFKGYYEIPEESRDDEHWKWCNQYNANIQEHTLKLRDVIQKVHGCYIYSLNPFIGIGLEGHEFQKSKKLEA